MTKILPTIKMVSETEGEHRHYNVSHDGTYLGYYMKNNFPNRAVGANWEFMSRHKSMHSFNARTRKELIETLTKQLNKEAVILYQDFGLTTKLNQK